MKIQVPTMLGQRVVGTVLVSAMVLFGLGCHGPTGLLPGGSLEGETRPTPTRWSLARDSGTAQLETDPAEPYSVNLAYTLLGGRLYVNAGNTETQWVRNMNANPLVRLRIDGVVYELQAERVLEAAEIEAFGAAWTSQSFFRRDPRNYDEVWIYRLGARS